MSNELCKIEKRKGVEKSVNPERRSDMNINMKNSGYHGKSHNDNDNGNNEDTESRMIPFVKKPSNANNNNNVSNLTYSYNTTPLDVSYDWTSLATEIKE